MPLTIRRAGPTDAEVIVTFNARLAEESEGKQLDQAILRSGVERALADVARCQYFLAQDGEHIVGQLMITYEWSDWRDGWIWWIQSVYVRREARQRGVFRALFEHVRQLAHETGDVVALRLYVERDNHVAQQTYARLGMRPTGYLVLERCPL